MTTTGKPSDKTNAIIDEAITSFDGVIEKVNAKKADATPEEIGLRLLKRPEPPKELPIYHYITNRHNIKEWDIFLAKN